MSGRVDEDAGMQVLKMMAKLYVTIRGFAFASPCFELYKVVAHKKKL